MQHVVKTPKDLGHLYVRLADMPQPFTVSIVKGEKRSKPQNSTIHMWYGEVARQLGDVSPEEIRAQCKLEIGAPILRRDDAGFRADYDAMFKPLPYAHKLRLFQRLDPNITSKMTVGQLREYMDEMQRRYADAGITLTDPEARKYEGVR